MYLDPIVIYLLKVNNRNTKTRVSIVNFEHKIAGWGMVTLFEALVQIFELLQ